MPRRPADDHLAGEASVEFLIGPPLPGERLLHRHHRSNVLRGNLRAEPEAPPLDLEHHVRPHPPCRARSGRTGRDRSPAPRASTRRDHARRRRPPAAGRARSAAGRTEAPCPARPAAPAPSPRLASATGTASSTAISSVPGSRRPHLGRLDARASRAPAARAARGSSNTLAVGRELERSRSPLPEQDTAIRRSPPASPGKTRAPEAAAGPNQSASSRAAERRRGPPSRRFRRRPATAPARGRPA